MNDDSADVRKSVGIDKEGGLVFALDTMQVMLVGDYNLDDIYANAYKDDNLKCLQLMRLKS